MILNCFVTTCLFNQPEARKSSSMAMLSCLGQEIRWRQGEGNGSAVRHRASYLMTTVQARSVTHKPKKHGRTAILIIIIMPNENDTTSNTEKKKHNACRLMKTTESLTWGLWMGVQLLTDNCGKSIRNVLRSSQQYELFKTQRGKTLNK